MPILEFATINLNPGVESDDPKLISVLHACISEISKADGISDIRFIKNNPQDTQVQILGLVGVWTSVEAHAAYLASGKMLPLLMDLKDFITMREVMHLRIDELSSSGRELISSDLVCATTSIKATDNTKFEELVQKVLPAGAQAVAGWKVKKEESFQKAESLGREKFGQEAKETGPEDVDTWAVFLPRGERNVVDKIAEITSALRIEDLEIQQWVGVWKAEKNRQTQARPMENVRHERLN